MFKVEKSVNINKPVEEVFAYTNDPSNTTKWQGAVESVKYPQGEAKVGVQYTEVRKFLGREMETHMEITALEPNKRYAAKTLSGPVSFQVTVNFEADGGGTKMTTTVREIRTLSLNSQREWSPRTLKNRLKSLLEE